MQFHCRGCSHKTSPKSQQFSFSAALFALPATLLYQYHKTCTCTVSIKSDLMEDTRESVSVVSKWGSCPDDGLLKGPHTVDVSQRDVNTFPGGTSQKQLAKFPSGARVSPPFAALRKHI